MSTRKVAESKAGSRISRAVSRATSKAASKAYLDPSLTWKETLLNQDIQPFTWKCQVGFLVEFNSNHITSVEYLNTTAATGLRPAVRVISQQFLYNKIREYSSTFRLKQPILGLRDDTRIYPYACDEALKFLESEEPIPAELWALLIKLEILQQKYNQMDSANRDYQQKATIEEEFESFTKPKHCQQAPKVEHTSSHMKSIQSTSNVTKKKRPKSAKSDKSSKSAKSERSPIKVAGNQPEKYVKLLKRGEEWREVEFISDSPQGGANLYIILTGFYDVNLLFELQKQNIPLMSIIQMRNEANTLDHLIPLPEKAKVQEAMKVWSHSQISAEEVSNVRCYGDEETLRSNAIRNFWTAYGKVMLDSPLYQKLENVAFMTYEPPDLSKGGDSEEIGEEIFENLSQVMYDVNNIYRQYGNYIRRMKLIDVDRSESASLIQMEDMTVYNGMMDQVPLECVTIPIILNCLIGQLIVMTNIPSEVETPFIPPDAKTLPTKSIIVMPSHKTIKSAKLSLRTVESLIISEAQFESPKECHGHRKRFARMFDRIADRHDFHLSSNDADLNSEKESHVMDAPTLKVTDVPVIYYGNDIQFRTFHVDFLNLEHYTVEVLFHHLIPNIWRDVDVLGRDKKHVCKKHLRRLLSGVQNFNIDKETLVHQLHLKVFENMYCKSPVAYGFKLPSHTEMRRLSQFSLLGDPEKTSTPKITPEPSFSSIKIKIDMQDILECRSSDELFKRLDKTDNMKNCTLIENLDKSVLLQRIYDASLIYLCIDYHHFPYTDEFLVHFHNPCPENGIAQDNWETHLPTRTCFRDFVNYVYDEIYDWIVLEEEKFAQAVHEEEKKCKEGDLNTARVEMNKLFDLEGVGSPIIPQPEDYLIKGSIKEQVMLKQAKSAMVASKSAKSLRSKSARSGKSAKSDISAKSHKSTKSSKSKKSKTDKKSKLDKKKSKSTAKFGATYQEQLEAKLFPPFPNDSVFAPKPIEPCTDSSFKFIGYLFNTRLQLSGHTTRISTQQNSSIHVDKSEWHNGSRTLNISISKNNHTLYLHSYADMPPTVVKPLTFHVITQEGIILVFSKESPMKPIAEEIEIEIGSVSAETKPSEELFSITDSPESSRTEVFVAATTPSSPDARLVKAPSLVIPSPPKRSSRTKPKSMTEPEPKQVKKFQERMGIEETLHKALLFEEVLDPKEIQESPMLVASKRMIIDFLRQAYRFHAPVYKIFSSKLHTFKYVKRIKKHTTINPAKALALLQANGKRMANSSIGSLKDSKSMKIGKSTLSQKSLMNQKSVVTQKSFSTDKSAMLAKSVRMMPDPSEGNKLGAASRMSRMTEVEMPQIVDEPRFGRRVSKEYAFRGCLPSGLMVETVATDDVDNPIYVKQFYVSKGPACGGISDEDYRCCLSNGSVVIFKSDGSIKILSADSSLVTCQLDKSEWYQTHKNGVTSETRPKKPRLNYDYKTTTCIFDRAFNKIMKARIDPHLIKSTTPLTTIYSRRFFMKKLKRSFQTCCSELNPQSDYITIPSYTFLSPDGSKTTVRDNKIATHQKKLVVETETDIFYNETYNIREDGTETFLTSEGTLITIFPDGTRILMDFDTEPEEVTLQLSEKENEELFYRCAKTFLRKTKSGKISLHRKDIRERILGRFVHTIPVVKFNGFVSVVLNCRIEHPNYASVEYNGMSKECSIHMPDNVKLRTGWLGEVKCNLDSETSLEISSGEIQFFNGQGDQGYDKSYVNITPFTCYCGEKGPTNYYIENVNSHGEIVLIDYQGFVEYEKKELDQGQNKHTRNANNLPRNERFFSIRRNLEGTEYMQKKSIDKYLHFLQSSGDYYRIQAGSEPDMCPGDYTLITHGIGKNYSEKWLIPYTIEIKPNYKKNRSKLPSTYYPQNYLAVYPRKKPNPNISETNSTQAPFNKPEPKAYVIRKFTELKLGCVTEQLTCEPTISKHSTPSAEKIVKSAMKDLWTKRSEAIQFYKKIILGEKVPHYFTHGMEKMLYEPKCCVESDCAGTEQYIPDLEKLSELWNKHNYGEQRPPGVKLDYGVKHKSTDSRTGVELEPVIFRKIIVEDDLVTHGSEEGLVPKIIRGPTNSECKVCDRCVCDKKAPSSKSAEQFKPNVYASQSSKILLEHITARSMKPLVKKHGTGAEPYVRPMELKDVNDSAEYEDLDTTATSMEYDD